ncbi:MAG TPA: aminoglycoside phosphotransferase family protein [Chloroflexota bacterium]|nr:aminoglycoside phosphotransferase family protein [Chloroflexota bacterium]
MDQIAALLRSRYGLAVERLERAPRGWTGETYAATIRGGSRVFVKVYPRDRLPPTAAPALPVLAELHRVGLSEVSRPIPTLTGALHERLGDDLVVVFAYLDAVPVPFTFGGERLGGLIGRIHRQRERIASPVTRETFATLQAGDLWRILARAREEPVSDEPRRGLRAFLDEQEPAIREGWEDFEAIARACHEASFELVLTHGDWPFNLLQGADDTLYLIDWDELLLAPAERDTWYAGDESAFWQGYRAQRPGHAASELATAYYVHHRYFEELISFAQTILGNDPLERRAWSIDLLGGDWMAGLRAQMRITPPP